MVIDILYIVGGLVLLVGGGEALVRGAVAFAKNLGVPSFVVGLTIVSYGTSAPELVVSVQSTLEGYPDLALGNVIGSNISNVLLILGVTALIAPIAAHRELAFRDGLLMLAVTVLLVGFSWNGILGVWQGVVFFAIAAGYSGYMFWRIKKHKDDSLLAEVAEEIPEVTMSTMVAFLFIVVGLLVMVGATELLISGSVSLARAIGVSEAVIGLTIIAIGSSAPELITSVVAALRRHADIAISNVIGSNFFNIVLILGITASIQPVEVAAQFLAFDYWVMLGTSTLLIGLMMANQCIGRVWGVLFLGGFVSYIVYQYLFTL